MFRYILIATKKGNTKKESKCIKEAIHNCVCSDLVRQEENAEVDGVRSVFRLSIKFISILIWMKESFS